MPGKTSNYGEIQKGEKGFRGPGCPIELKFRLGNYIITRYLFLVICRREAVRKTRAAAFVAIGMNQEPNFLFSVSGLKNFGAA